MLGCKEAHPKDADNQINNCVNSTPLYIASAPAPDECEYSLCTDNNLVDSSSINPPSTNTEPIPPEIVSSSNYDHRRTPSPYQCSSPITSQPAISLEPTLFTTLCHPALPRALNTEDTDKTVDYKWLHTR